MPPYSTSADTRSGCDAAKTTLIGRPPRHRTAPRVLTRPRPSPPGCHRFAPPAWAPGRPGPTCRPALIENKHTRMSGNTTQQGSHAPPPSKPPHGRRCREKKPRQTAPRPAPGRRSRHPRCARSVSQASSCHSLYPRTDARNKQEGHALPRRCRKLHLMPGRTALRAGHQAKDPPRLNTPRSVAPCSGRSQHAARRVAAACLIVLLICGRDREPVNRATARGWTRTDHLDLRGSGDTEPEYPAVPNGGYAGDAASCALNGV